MESTYDRIQYYKIGQTKKDSILSKLKTLLTNEKQVKTAWIFGSLTRRDSIRDIDIAIHAEPEFSFKELLYLNAQLELELGLPVDMVEISQVPQSFQERILLTGIRIKGNKSLEKQLQRASV